MPRSLTARLVLIALAATALGACSLLPPEAVPQALNPVVVTYVTEGGECPQGPCGFQAEIRRDGTVKRSDGMAQTVDEPSLARLIEQVEAADWRAILARPFTGECPRNFDGTEITFTFPSAAGDVVVASCTTQIDPGQEPFESIQNALFAAGG